MPPLESSDVEDEIPDLVEDVQDLVDSETGDDMPDMIDDDGRMQPH